MAWNPTPKVAAARDFGKRFDRPMVIIIHIGEDGSIGYASHGKTPKLCKTAKRLADFAFDAILNLGESAVKK